MHTTPHKPSTVPLHWIFFKSSPLWQVCQRESRNRVITYKIAKPAAGGNDASTIQ